MAFLAAYGINTNPSSVILSPGGSVSATIEVQNGTIGTVGPGGASYTGISGDPEITVSPGAGTSNAWHQTYAVVFSLSASALPGHTYFANIEGPVSCITGMRITTPSSSSPVSPPVSPPVPPVSPPVPPVSPPVPPVSTSPPISPPASPLPTSPPVPYSSPILPTIPPVPSSPPSPPASPPFVPANPSPTVQVVSCGDSITKQYSGNDVFYIDAVPGQQVVFTANSSTALVLTVTNPSNVFVAQSAGTSVTITFTADTLGSYKLTIR